MLPDNGEPVSPDEVGIDTRLMRSISAAVSSEAPSTHAQGPSVFWTELARTRSDSAPSGSSWAAEWNQTAAHWQQQVRSPPHVTAPAAHQSTEVPAAAEYARAMREAEVQAVSAVEQMHAIETRLLASELQAEESGRAQETHKLARALEQAAPASRADPRPPIPDPRPQP